MWASLGGTCGVLLTALALSGPALADHWKFDQPRVWASGDVRVGWFADVTGDGRADAIGADPGGRITVRVSDGCRLGPTEYWTGSDFVGTVKTSFADVTGDRRADAIRIDDTGPVTVRRSNYPRERRFLSNKEEWTYGDYYGNGGWFFFVDVTGDAKADAIRVEESAVTVRWSYGNAFGQPQDWTQDDVDYLPGYFADVTGDGKADAIETGSPRGIDAPVVVHKAYARVNHPLFGDYGFFERGENWTVGDYDLSRLSWVFFADVTGKEAKTNPVPEVQTIGSAADLVTIGGDPLDPADQRLKERFAGEDSSRPNGKGFLPEAGIGATDGPYAARAGLNRFADVDGDGAADAIQVTTENITVRRSRFADSENRCVGTPNADVIKGKPGGDVNDRILGRTGNDRIFGGPGNDRLSGGPGNDRIFGGPGNDRIFGGPGNDRLSGGPGKDRLSGGPGNDRILGGRGKDRLSGGPGTDRLFGNSGRDVIRARDGERDVVRCGTGVDRVRADRVDRLSRDCERISRR
jgi:Ca2+-binding RTX toxin-like protein